LLWWLDDHPSLSKRAKTAIADSGNLVVLSAVVIWEIRIKQSLGKLTIPSDFFDIVKEQGFESISITSEHAHGVGDLPMHHRDPFDRLLIVQAKQEGFTIVTADAVFEQYEVPILN